MTQPNHQIAILAPSPLLNAFRILVQATPNLEVMAADNCLDSLLAIIGHRNPDICLVYLARQHPHKQYECVSVEAISKIQSLWPFAKCIAIVHNAQQRDRAKELGADATLLEGVTPSRLISNINNLYRQRPQGPNVEEVEITK